MIYSCLLEALSQSYHNTSPNVYLSSTLLTFLLYSLSILELSITCILVFFVETIISEKFKSLSLDIFCRNYYLRKIQVLITSGTVSFYCSCVTSFLLFANINITTLQLTFFIVRCFSLAIDLIRLYYSLLTRAFIRHVFSTI